MIDLTFFFLSLLRPELGGNQNHAYNNKKKCSPHLKFWPLHQCTQCHDVTIPTRHAGRKTTQQLNSYGIKYILNELKQTIL